MKSECRITEYDSSQYDMSLNCFDRALSMASDDDMADVWLVKKTDIYFVPISHPHCISEHFNCFGITFISNIFELILLGIILVMLGQL